MPRKRTKKAREYRRFDREAARVAAPLIHALLAARMTNFEITSLRLSDIGRDACGFRLGPVGLDAEATAALRAVVARHPSRNRRRFVLCDANALPWTPRQVRYARQVAAGEFDAPAAPVARSAGILAGGAATPEHESDCMCLDGAAAEFCTCSMPSAAAS